MQTELSQPGPLLDANGKLAQVGWSRKPLLDCNLENSRFHRFRIKRWDYYAVFTPQRFFSATIADLGYAGNIFVYTLEFATGELHEEGLVIPLGNGIKLERNPEAGEASFVNDKVSLQFQADGDERRVKVDWAGFNNGRGIHADITLRTLPEHESMNIIIPIGEKRFYDNTKINCMTAQDISNMAINAKTCSLKPASARWIGGAVCGNIKATGIGPARRASYQISKPSG